MNGAELDTNRWQRLKDVFNEAVELAPESRLSYLSALRLSDKTLYQELAGLVEVDAEARDFPDQPVALEADSAALPSPISETVGNYRIVREIERGGMVAAIWQSFKARKQQKIAEQPKLIRRTLNQSRGR